MLSLSEEAAVPLRIYGRSMKKSWQEPFFECSIPIISAVGHETDTTIADYVADLRAPTPSAAAELAVYDWRELEQQFLAIRMELNRGISDKLELTEQRLRQYERQLKLLTPQNRLNEKRQYVVDLEEKLRMYMQQKLLQKKHQLELYAGQLEGMSPVKKIKSGIFLCIR